jgi:hypothetical protein
MSQTLVFKTTYFDISKERKNPINPIYGLSLLEWLRTEFKGKIEISEPEAEDWGWYSELNYEGFRYQIGSHCEFETGDAPHQAQTWVFQVVKHRSLTDKILGRNKQEATDACFLFFKAQFENTPSFKDVQTR